MFYVDYFISLTHLCFNVFLSVHIVFIVFSCTAARVFNKLTYLLTIVNNHNLSNVYHIIIIYLLKSDNTNSKRQHRVTELDGQGSEGALTAVYRDNN